MYPSIISYPPKFDLIPRINGYMLKNYLQLDKIFYIWYYYTV